MSWRCNQRIQLDILKYKCYWIPSSAVNPGHTVADRQMWYLHKAELCSFLWIPHDILFMWRYPFPAKWLAVQQGWSEHIQGQQVRVSRVKVSDALILSQTRDVVLPLDRHSRRWSKRDKGLLVFGRGLWGGWRGGAGGDRDWWRLLCGVGQRGVEAIVSRSFVSIV